ncbi:MAG: PorV/PorQ family protein [Candidatus Eisenbacteria sp.]|nr:PorV/PorQ family protein [Candidatus Eisenbacteria bacterium]
MRRILVVVALVVGLAGLGAREACAVSEAAAPSLIIPPGARACGLGQSFVGIADDATAMYWNPAGIAFTTGRNVALMHSQLIPELADDVYYEYFGYTQEIQGLGMLGLSFTFLTYGKWQAMGESGEEGDFFSSYEFALGGTYAALLADNISAGVSLKLVHVSLAPASATVEGEEGIGTSFAADLGLLWRLFHGRVNLGANLQNIGPDISFIDVEQSAPLPRNLKTGVGIVMLQSDLNRVLGSFEVNVPLTGLERKFDDFAAWSDDVTLNGGVEWGFSKFLALRAGYIHDPDGDIEGMTYGGGLHISSVGLTVDYATVPKAKDIGREDKFSITVGF